MADDSNGQRWTFETSDADWSQKSTLVYPLNPELMHRSIITDDWSVDMPVTIYLRFTFILTIFDIFMLVIDYQIDYQIWWLDVWA